jgi:hypothetical protein
MRCNRKPHGTSPYHEKHKPINGFCTLPWFGVSSPKAQKEMFLAPVCRSHELW